MVDPARDELVVLKVCASTEEASVVRGLLEAQGIQCAVQGEQTVGVLPHLAGVLSLRVLVPSGELERAKKLVFSSEPVLQAIPSEGPHGDARCVVHDKAAIATCSRCGNFLCESCRALGAPPLCEDCLAAPEPRRRNSWVRIVAVLLLLPLALSVAVLILVSVFRLFGVFR